MTAIEEKEQLAAELKKLGFELVFTSDSGSEYFHAFFKTSNDYKSIKVRLSDHFIPETEERNCQENSAYDYELIFDNGYEDDNKETLEFLEWLKTKS